jgi:SAM-dependent methyltransferase
VSELNNIPKQFAPNDPVLRLNTLCPYFTMFPLAFPLAQLRNATTEASVLDPFCGRGTTNFAARLLGLRSVGVDTNPVAIAIARAKFASVGASQVVRRAEDILRSRRQLREVPDGPFWQRCFHPKTLQEIAKIRDHLLTGGESQTSTLLRALIVPTENHIGI